MNMQYGPPSLASDDAADYRSSLTYINDCMNAPGGVFDDYGNCVFVPPPYTKSSPSYPIDCVGVQNCQIIYPPRDPYANECVYYVEQNFKGLAIALGHAPPNYDTGRIPIADIYEDIERIASIKCGSDAMALSDLGGT